MNAVETVYRAMGWRPALWNGRYWHEPGAPEEAVAYPLPDPLADTPEGWWEFGQILEWAEWSVQWDVAMAKVFDSMWRLEKGVGNQFRAAFIETLAEELWNKLQEVVEPFVIEELLALPTNTVPVRGLRLHSRRRLYLRL